MVNINVWICRIVLKLQRRIIMMLLEYHQYSVVAFISLCYRKIKICKEKRNEINDVI